MNAHARLTRVLVRPQGGLLAADIEGRLHLLDENMNLVRSSRAGAGPGITCGAPIYAMAIDGDWVYTRDKVGNICRWRLADLSLVNRLSASGTCDRSLLMPGEEPSPTMIRGFGVWQGKGYVSNGYFQLVVIDLADFTVERIVSWPYGDRRLEAFCAERPGQQAVTDREGNIYLGSLAELDLPVCTHLDDGNIHRVRWDHRHDRFWVTLDAGLGPTRNIDAGVATVTPDGRLDQQSLWAHNDVECLDLDADATRVYSGGFDGTLQIFDNTTRELTIAAVVGNFSHQILDCVVDAAGFVYVLTQDGEIVKLDRDGAFVDRLGYQRQCVWDLRADPQRADVLLAATDDGVAEIRLAESGAGLPSLVIDRVHRTGLGFTRRVVAMTDGWCGIGWDRSVFRAGVAGDLRWDVELDDVVHELAVSADGARVLVLTTGGAVELDARTGDRIAETLDLGAPAWAGCYVGCDRVIATANGRLLRIAADGTSVWDVEIDRYPKRADLVDGLLRVCGGGGVKSIDPADGRVLRTYNDLLDNTVENGTVADGYVCAISYGLQLGVYDHDSTELLGLFEDLPDFPKGIATITDSRGAAHVIVGGRGGYLRLYRVERTSSDAGPAVTALGDVWLPKATAIQQPALRPVHSPAPVGVLV